MGAERRGRGHGLVCGAERQRSGFGVPQDEGLQVRRWAMSRGGAGRPPERFEVVQITNAALPLG